MIKIHLYKTTAIFFIISLAFYFAGCADSADDNYDPGFQTGNCEGAAPGEACYNETYAPNAPICDFCRSSQCIGGTVNEQPITFCTFECNSDAQCSAVIPGGCCGNVNSKGFCFPKALCGNTEGKNPGEACTDPSQCKGENMMCLGSEDYGHFCSQQCTNPEQCTSNGFPDGCCAEYNNEGRCVPEAFCSTNSGKNPGEACTDPSQCNGENMLCLGSDDYGHFCSQTCTNHEQCTGNGFPGGCCVEYEEEGRCVPGAFCSTVGGK